MKRLILGDMHGDFPCVERIYNKEKPDIVIMLGDYFDSFTIEPADQGFAWNNLMLLKNKHNKEHGNDTFITLMGNHDFHYLGSMVNEQYTGYNRTTQMLAEDMIREFKKNHMPFVFVDNINNIIFTHAGITNTWINNCGLEKIEDLNYLNLKYFKHTMYGALTSYDALTGNTPYNSPIWVRPVALSEDAYKDKDNNVWTQIVGHTAVKEIVHVTDNGNDIWLCDTLPHHYLIEEIDDDSKKLIERKIVKVKK